MKSSVYKAIAISSLDTLSFAIIITTFDRYIYSIGGTQFFLGVLGSCAALLILICNPIIGSLSDRWGRRKVLQYSMANGMVANLLTASFSSLPVIFLSRLMAALGCQNMSLVKSLIDDSIAVKEEKDRVMNHMQAIAGVQFILGALIGGFMSGFENGTSKAFYLIVTLCAINFGLVSTIEQEELKPESKTPKKSIKNPAKTFSVKDVFTQIFSKLINVNWSKYWLLLVIKLLIDISLNINFFNMSNILINQYGLSGEQFGYVFAGMSITGVVSGIGIVKLKHYFYSNDQGFTRILHVFILLLSAFILATVAPNFWIFFLSLIPMSVGRTLQDSTMTEMILSQAAPSEKGSILGAFDNTMALAGLVVPLMCGIITNTWGVIACNYLCIVLSVVGIVISIVEQTKLKTE